MPLEQNNSSNCKVPHSDSCMFADAAAESAVKKTFAILGVDVDNAERVEDFRDSLRFGDKLRRIADRGVLAFVITFISCVVGAMWISLTKGH